MKIHKYLVLLDCGHTLKGEIDGLSPMAGDFKTCENVECKGASSLVKDVVTTEPQTVNGLR